MADGLQEDGGINFGRKKNFGKPKKEPYGLGKPESPEEEVEESVIPNIEELEKDARLNAKLSKAKGIQAGGFALNGTTVSGALFYFVSLLVNPDTLDTLNNLNDTFDMNINFEQIIATIQGYKAQIIGFAVSSQTMIMGYKDMAQKMKDKGNESFYEVFSEELEKAGL